MMSAFDDASALCAPYIDATGLDGASITTFGSTVGAETVAASNPMAARIDELQLDLGVGPAWDAVASQAVVRVPSLIDSSSWSVLRDACLALGARSMLAFPVAFGGVGIGAVTTYATQGRAVGDRIVDALVLQTRTTALLLLAETVAEASREESANPRSRRIVHQATGMVLARYGLSSADALAMLQARAFSSGISVTEMATAIVGGRSDFLDPDGPSVGDRGAGGDR